jgi:hypothetical protein
MPHNTRSKRGPLIDKKELDLVQGRIENDYLQRAMDFYHMKGRIDPERLDDVLAKAAEYKAAAKKRGSSRRRGRKTRSTRRR